MTEILRITVDTEVTALRVIRQALSKALASALKRTSLEGKINNIILATDEAAQNIIKHAFLGQPDGKMTVIAEICGQTLHVYLEDTAPLVDLETIAPRDLADVREGGLGTHFIKTLTDEAIWSHHNNQNRLDMRWQLDR